MGMARQPEKNWVKRDRAVSVVEKRTSNVEGEKKDEEVKERKRGELEFDSYHVAANRSFKFFYSLRLNGDLSSHKYITTTIRFRTDLSFFF